MGARKIACLSLLKSIMYKENGMLDLWRVEERDSFHVILLTFKINKRNS